MINFISKKEFYILKKELKEVKEENQKLKKEIEELRGTLENNINERFDYLFEKMYEVKKQTQDSCTDMVNSLLLKERYELINFEAKLMKRVLKIDN